MIRSRSIPTLRAPCFIAHVNGRIATELIQRVRELAQQAQRYHDELIFHALREVGASATCPQCPGRGPDAFSIEVLREGLGYLLVKAWCNSCNSCAGAALVTFNKAPGAGKQGE